VNRRHLIWLLGGAATVWPFAAIPRQAGRPVIGFMGSATPAAWRPWTRAFVERLNELGWVEGRNVAIEYRWSEGRPDRIADITAEFVQRDVDVILTYGNAVAAVMKTTSTIPIVFAIAKDPVGNGFVASLSHPGGNVTGLSIQANDTTSKRLELLREIVRDLHRVAIMGNAGYPDAALEMQEAEVTARTMGIGSFMVEIKRAEDISPAFDSLKDKADALYVVTDSLINTYRTRIITRSLGAQLPTTFNTRDYVEVGGLMAYGPNYSDQFRRAADYVDKILHGTKPSEIPVEQPTKFDFVINLSTAKALSLAVPDKMLAIADEVIE
jgi:putative tryptophan/tyrosine transport system substrate-binding protein